MHVLNPQCMVSLDKRDSYRFISLSPSLPPSPFSLPSPHHTDQDSGSIISMIQMSPSEGLVSMAVDSSPSPPPPSLPLSLSLYVPIVSVDSSIDITSMIRMSPSEGLVSMAVDSPSPSPSPSSELELSVELDCLACLFILCLARLDWCHCGGFK